MMKKNALLFLVVFSLSFISNKEINQNAIQRFQYEKFLKQHKYNRPIHLSEEEIKRMPKKDRPDLAMEQDFLATLDPALGFPDKDRLIPVFKQVQAQKNAVISTPGSATFPWVERGPNNVGGRTRAIMYDPNDATQKKVWAGGVTGGLWYNNDITSSTSSWNAVNDFWDNIAITCIAYDPNDSNTFYVGTGEGWFTRSSRGAGIWKSTNGGSSWSQISSTSNYYFVNDIVVRNESGTSVIYAAVEGSYYAGSWHNSASSGLRRSSNGGTSWTQVLPNIPSETYNYVAADIEIAANNDIWVGTKASPYGLTDRGGGRVLKSSNGTTWTTTLTESVTNGDGRVELACAPSNSNYVYAVIENNSAVKVIKQTINKGTSWSTKSLPNDADLGIPSSDFTRGQAWYDLIMAVDPNNANTVLVGGVDLFRSTNGGTAWSQISKWSNNQNLNTLSCSLVHADQHAIVFKPGSSSQVLFGTDGGVYYSNNISSAATSNVISARVTDYNVTQFYACAIHPTSGTNHFLAGSQDNGSHKFTSAGINSTTEVTGGDGAFCHIDQTNANTQITSYVYNSYYYSSNGGSNFYSMYSDQNTGKFINPTDYDDNQNMLFAARSSTSLLRLSNIGSSPTSYTMSISSLGSMASHLRVSPHTTSSTTLFVGTESGKLIKITNANSSSFSTSDITGSSFPAGNISCVEIGSSDNELLVTFSNYGVTSVWYTSNGGTTWVSKEGNLPDMPVRWALFNPNNLSEVILATEVGVWSSTDFNLSVPTWAASNSGLANVRVDMLQIRDSDDEVIAATHGRGLFSSNGFTASLSPTADFYTNRTIICSSDTLSLVDNSSTGVTSRIWEISPSTFSFINGTNVGSLNPDVTFSANGTYSIKLKASNVNGTDSITKVNHVMVGGATLPYTETWEDTLTYINWNVANPDTGITWAIANVGGSTPGSTAVWVDNYNYSTSDVVSQIDNLLTPPMNLTGYTGATLNVDYAYVRYSAAYQDSLSISVSSDCGGTWTTVANFLEDGTNNYVTSALSTASFSPSTTADWCGSSGYASCISVDLSAYAGLDDVRISFNNLSGWGNNIYLDNINVIGSTNPLNPVVQFSVNDSLPCIGDTITLTDMSTNSPTGWSWSISPSSYSFVNGTTSSSQNPQLIFNSSGNYSVSLTATNSSGSGSLTKSNYIQLDPLTVVSVMVAGPDTVCSGSSAFYTATPTNGGSLPMYQWKRNGINVGSNSDTITLNSVSNNDSVWVVLTSSLSCVSSATANSNKIEITVTPSIMPTISVVGTSYNICQGTSVTFTASYTNGGPNRDLEWRINGILTGDTGVTFTSSTLIMADEVSCRLKSTIPCAAITYAFSNAETMFVTAYPNVTLTAIPDICIDSTTLTLNNGSPVGGSYSGPGVSNGVFDPLVAGIGLHTIQYSYSTQYGCADSSTTTIRVLANPPKPVVSISNFLLTATNASGYNVQWYLNGSVINGATSVTYTAVANGSYRCEYTHPITNCNSRSSIVPVSGIGIEELEAAFGLEVFPNPTIGDVSIKLANVHGLECSISIYSASGQKVYYKEFPPSYSLEENIDLSGNANGVYLVNILVGDKLMTKRITLQ